MSRKKTRPVASPPPSPPTAEHPGALPADVAGDTRGALDKQREKDTIAMLNKFRKEVGNGEGFVTLERRNPLHGQHKFGGLGTQLPIADFSIEEVARIYGGGDFIARGRVNGGKFEEGLRVDFTIDHTIPPKNPLAPVGEKKEPAAPAAPPVDVAGIIREIREGSKADASAVIELAKAAMQRPEPKGEAAAMLELVKELRDESRRSEERILKLIEKMSERNAPEPAPTLREQLEEQEELDKLRGVSHRRGGGDGDGGPWKDIVKSAIEALAPLARQYFGGGAPGAPGPLALPAGPLPVTAPPPSPENPAAAAAQAQDDPMKNPLFTAALNHFRTKAIEAAKKGRDPFELVSNMLDVVPENYLGLIFNTANHAEWFSRIFGTDAAAMQHVEFLGEVRAAVITRAFVAHAKRNAGLNAPAEAVARGFADWCYADFHPWLLEGAQDAEVWAETFEGEGIDPAWLEALRLAVIAELGGGNVVAMPAAGVTAPGEPNAPASQPGGVTARDPAGVPPSQKTEGAPRPKRASK